MIWATILSALLPAVIETGKAAIASKLNGVKALTVDDQIKLDDSEVKRLQALASLDTPGGTPSQWVVDLRASARYVGSLTVIFVGVGASFVPEVPVEVKLVVLEAANIAFGFLFGSRITASVMGKLGR
jgi:hypothetical protein